MKSHSSGDILSAAEIRWKAFARAQHQVIETLLKGPCPVVFILIFLRMITALMIFRLKVFRNQGEKIRLRVFVRDVIQPHLFSLCLMCIWNLQFNTKFLREDKEPQ